MLWLVAQHKQILPRGRAARLQRARMLLMLADTMQTAPFLTEILEARELLEQVV
ncbi:MAG: hypothetical protein GWO02_08140, partial [Gammaproteobacteria bacterium]|nr:hypothetical protein [Gammaproteobacteria bacterium]